MIPEYVGISGAPEGASKRVTMDRDTPGPWHKRIIGQHLSWGHTIRGRGMGLNHYKGPISRNIGNKEAGQDIHTRKASSGLIRREHRNVSELTLHSPSM